MYLDRDEQETDKYIGGVYAHSMLTYKRNEMNDSNDTRHGMLALGQFCSQDTHNTCEVVQRYLKVNLELL